MTTIPFTVAAEAALTRQNIALSVVKQSAEQSRQIANIIDEAVRSAPVSNTRGANVNIQA